MIQTKNFHISCTGIKQSVWIWVMSQKLLADGFKCRTDLIRFNDEFKTIMDTMT